MYLTYDEFIEEGYDDVSEAEYERHALRAEGLIDRMTHGRIRSEDPPRACVRAAMADLIAQSLAAAREDRQNGGREVASVSNDGVSVSYAAQGNEQARRRQLRAQIVIEYLSGETDARGVRLLYAGVDA